MIEFTKQKLRDQVARLKLTNLYKSVFLSHEGRLVLKDMAVNCSYDRTVFNKDALKMAYEEGRRSVILDILNRLAYTMDDVMYEEFEEPVDV